MRIRQLGLMAYGPFSDVRLDFASAPEAVHVVYGTNEAGKSTTLRAISALLFGIPHQTPDAHRHGPRELKIYGALENGHGEVLEVVRRKGRKGTLRSPDGSLLDEAALRRLLAGVSEPAFSIMFGLDHYSLVQGARAMLEGKGDVGESLFGAGIGGRGVHALLEELKAESEQLFTPRGRSKKLINQAVAELRESKRAVDDAATSAKSYAEQKRALEAAERRKEALKAQSRELRAEQSRLQRILSVLPGLAERSELLSRLNALEDVPRLPRDARERRLAAQRAVEEAGREIERERSRLDRLESDISQLSVPESLLHLDPAMVEDIQQRLHRYKSTRSELPKKRGALGEIERRIERGLGELRRDIPVQDAERLRMGPGAVARIKTLADRRGELVSDVRHARRQLERRQEEQRQLADRIAALEASCDSAPLEQALEDAGRAGDLSRRIGESEARLVALNEEAEARRAALVMWTGTLEEARALDPPDVESVDRFASARQELDARRRRLDDEVEEVTDRIREIDGELERVTASGEVPTEEELSEVRWRRDEAWERLRAGADRGAYQARDADAYESLVHEADRAADRLWRDASRVTRVASLRASRSALSDKLERLEESQRGLGEQEAALQRDWRRLWSPLGIEPGSADEMRLFIRRFSALDELVRKRDRAREELGALERERAQQVEQLTAALQRVGAAPPDGATWRQLFSEARSVLDRLNAAEAERKELAEHRLAVGREVQQLERECAERQAALDAWQEQWQSAVEPLGLKGEASPQEALAVLECSGELLRSVDEASSMRASIEAARDDCERFEADVQVLCRQHAPHLVDLPAAEAAHGLLRAHEQAERDEHERRRRVEEMDRARAAVEQHETEQRRARGELEMLMRAAGVDAVEALEDLEKRAEEKAEVEARLEAVAARLLASGEGATIEQLAEQARQLDVDRAHARLGEIESELEECEESLVGTIHDFERARAGLGRFEESDAAEAALAVEQRVARLRNYVERYVRVRLAARILEQEIERYRQENQGPLLSRGGEVFSKLTLGRYVRLDAAFDDKERPVLRCIRADGRELGVEQLSEGTASQLYLALRLATLERYAASSEPMPVVLDDVLIHFDDERASAALELLGDLSRSTQVLFFTHHARLVDLARRAIPPERLAEHELPRAPS